MKDKNKVNSALLALTASALSLPGISRAETATEGTVDYRYSNYREGAIAADKSASGNAQERYTIESHQFRLSVPLSDQYSIAANATLETMSGASPWYVQPDSNNKPVQVMSGPSIKEDRVDLSLSAVRMFSAGELQLSLGQSDEDDYQASNIGLSGEWDLADTVSTISGGVGYSDDELNPTQGTTSVSVTQAERDSVTAFVGYARILGKNTVAQASVSRTEHNGFLSDPYKQAFIQNPSSLLPDARPNERVQMTWLARLRHYFKDLRAALHLDYRYYEDSWDVESHTLDMAWYQQLGGGVTLTPGIRWYSQSAAEFYAPFYTNTPSNGFVSSDYRLSPYGALSFSLDINKQFNGWRLGLRYENYQSSGDWALGNVAVENPGLVDFEIWSFGLSKSF